VTGGLSAQVLADVAVRDWSDDFTFVIGDHRYWCQSSVAQFLSPQVSKLHWMDLMISELRLEVDDRDSLFDSVLKAAAGGNIAVDSAHRRTFASICAALYNSGLCKYVSGQLSDEVPIGNVLDGLEFLSATRCGNFTGLEFIASDFSDFLRRLDALNTVPFSGFCRVLLPGPLSLEVKCSTPNRRPSPKSWFSRETIILTRKEIS
jgi:hypothetical protein